MLLKRVLPSGFLRVVVIRRSLYGWLAVRLVARLVRRTVSVAW